MSRKPYDLASPGYKRNPYPTLERLLADGPIVPFRYPLIGRFWMATTWPAASELLRDRQTFVREPHSAGQRRRANLPWWFPRSMQPLAESMINRDEPDHRRLRSLVDQAFQRRNIEQLRPRFETLVDELLDGMEREHSANGQPVDLVARLARPFPLAVISELLGLPQADRMQFTHYAQTFTDRLSLLQLWRIVQAMKGLSRYLRGQIDQCRREPREGLISALLAAEHDGARITDDELLAMVILILMAGHVTTVHLIGGGVHTLLQHPEALADLQADWSNGETAVNELLRYLSPVQTSKPMLVARDLEWQGHRFRRGERILACLASANVDPQKFENPLSLNLRRAPNPHLAFGAGIHVCLGMKLAVAETEIAFRRLFTHFPQLSLAVPEDEVRWSRQPGTRGMESLPVKW